jgi:flagellar biosynthesis chaperone FliJ
VDCFKSLLNAAFEETAANWMEFHRDQDAAKELKRKKLEEAQEDIKTHPDKTLQEIIDRKFAALRLEVLGLPKNGQGGKETKSDK